MSFKSDYNLGINKENEILPVLKEFFKRDIIKNNNTYSKYDFEDNKYKYELKYRRNNYNTFNTTLIAVDKVIEHKQIFIFAFTDGVYYIKYRKSKFDTFETKPFLRNKRNDYNDIKKDYFFIPIEKLKKII